MTIALILVVFAALMLALFPFWIRGSGIGAGDGSNTSARLVPVDLDAFRNLIDEKEQEFLRANLPRSEFRSVQRARLRAAVDYVAGVFQNAGILLRFGQAARRSSDPEVAEAGRHLVDNAARLRLYAALATGKFYVRIMFPEADLGTAGIVDNYHQTSEYAALIGRLQDPAKRALISSSL